MIEFEEIPLDNLIDDGFSIVTEEISDNLNEQPKEQETYPILPVKNTVVFPKVILPITAGRNKSIKLLQEAYQNKEYIGIVSQKNPNIESLNVKDLNLIGTISKIIKIIELPNGNITAITRGIHRFKI